MPAIVSILHRISGVVLFLLLPMMVWAFGYSLQAEKNFDYLQNYLSLPWVKLLFWLLLVPFCVHLIAGIRHLLLDMHIGEGLRAGRLSAKLTIVFSIILALLVGVWLW